MPFPIDHDMHCHTQLSSCSSDPAQTVQALLEHAKRCDYTVQCVTDHLWDSAVPGASKWYAPQDIAHVKQNLPLPKDDRVRMVFGCETEFCGGTKLGLAPEHYGELLEAASGLGSDEEGATACLRRLEEISRLDLPWKKVGIAHITCGLIFREGDQYRVFRLADEKRFRAVMRRFADLGAGIEINTSSFKPGWREQEDDALRLYRLAAGEGCRFYLATDAHHPKDLDLVPERAPEIVGLLGLTETEQFMLP